MGAIQSVNYPGDYPQKLSPNNLPDITVVKVNKPGSYSSVTLVDRGDIKIVQKHFENQLRMLDSYLNLYQLKVHYTLYCNKTQAVWYDPFLVLN